MDLFSIRVGHIRVNLVTSKRLLVTREIIIVTTIPITREADSTISLTHRPHSTHLTMQTKTLSGTILTLRKILETSLVERFQKKSS